MNIDIESLDWELLERVALTEGRRLSKESWNIDDISTAASSALAEIYVEGYLDAPEAIVLPLTAFEEIAQGLMSSFGNIDLDYSDLEDIDSRIEGALGGLLCDKGHQSRAIGR